MLHDLHTRERRAAGRCDSKLYELNQSERCSMQFILLLPQLPHADDGRVLERLVNDGRPSAVRRGRTSMLATADFVWRRLGVAYDRSGLFKPRA
jgi:hypothetical protein